MAALLPILQEILPMLMPGSVHITKAEELQGPPRDAVVPEEDDLEDEGEYDEEGFDGDHEDEEDEAEPETMPPRIVEGEPSATKDKPKDAAGGADEQKTRDIDETLLPLRPAAQPVQPSHKSSQQPKEKKTRPRPNKHARRLPHNGVSLRDAIVQKSGSLCASVLTVKPQCSTVVFHNGEQEAIVYAVSGTAVLATLPEDFDEVDEFDDNGSSSSARKPPATATISAGDFAFIPAWTEHQVRNEAPASPESADVVWVVVRNAGEPTVVPLQGWGGEQAE
ncbi:hypothetical protein Sste5346_005143 [Sporothrix stenoceras]|uniref:Cupin 2 conserved barrel domain-containing protein n=1 Tax=Sporothrix stenoceras TaxID=5173 RepID=A0ABR3Z642_9PEZI